MNKLVKLKGNQSVIDKTNWAEVISTTQDMVDRKSIKDNENPDLTGNKFVKSQKSKQKNEQPSI